MPSHVPPGLLQAPNPDTLKFRAKASHRHFQDISLSALYQYIELDNGQRTHDSVADSWNISEAYRPNANMYHRRHHAVASP